MHEETTNRKDVLKFYDKAARSPSSNSLARRQETRIFHLRNANNWAKSILISQYVDRCRQEFGTDRRLKVLDFCCGKGGDQIKWAHGDVDHVTFVDLSGASIDACKFRYEALRRKRYRLFSADFHVADCTIDQTTEGFLNGKIFELISCQFSLHYAFETWKQTHAFLNNVSQSLRSGGFFIATVPNAYEIVRRANQVFKQSKNDDDGIAFGNSIYSVSFPSSSFSLDPSDSSCKSNLKFPLFGASYDFHLEDVVDCPEFLVYPPLLNQLAKEHSLIPVIEATPFDQFFWDTLRSPRRGGPDPMDLLVRMKALEPLSDQADNDEDTALRTNGTRRNMWTISKELWDVFTLYNVVAFQKC